MNFFDSLRADFRTRATEPQAYSAAGRKVVCSHCSGDRFLRREAKLNTGIATFFNLDWLNRSGAAMVCTNCSHVEWYLETPEPLTTL